MGKTPEEKAAKKAKKAAKAAKLAAKAQGDATPPLSPGGDSGAVLGLPPTERLEPSPGALAPGK